LNKKDLNHTASIKFCSSLRNDKTAMLTTNYFPDAMSFVYMKREKIKFAFAFDKHFAQAGFKTLPSNNTKEYA